MLDMLDRSSDDHLVLNHAKLLLEDYEQSQDEIQRLLCSLLSLLLGAFSIHLDQDSTLFTQIRLLQFRLASPITNNELISIQHYIETCADQITQSDNANFENIKSTFQPLFESFGLDSGKSLYTEARHKQIELVDKNSINTSVAESIVGLSSEAIRDFGESLDNFFSENYLSNGIEQSEKYAAMLEVELASLKHTDDQQQFEERKDGVISELEKILASHKLMTTSIQQVSDFVTTLQQDSKRLNQELDRVTMLSLTDELTALPNRRAFLARLEDEIARVKRYKHKLSIALLDIDHFKPINDLYGHNVGDRVLKNYADNVLSAFRQFDMVARYGGEEFVVIFPNTDIEGAFQALKKVQQRTESLTIKIDDDSITLPTFSAGLVEYQGETDVESLIHRADTALYEAKLNGRNRIEMEKISSEIEPEHH